MYGAAGAHEILAATESQMRVAGFRDDFRDSREHDSFGNGTAIRRGVQSTRCIYRYRVSSNAPIRRVAIGEIRTPHLARAIASVSTTKPTLVIPRSLSKK